MDIYKELIKLPDELKLVIIKKLPIEYLIDINEQNVSEFINDYIINYIDNNILYDMYTASYLHRTLYYKKYVKESVLKISLGLTKKFMYYNELYSNGIININSCINKNVTIISLNIYFKFTTIGEYYNGLTNDNTYTITNVGFGDSNQCRKYYYGTTLYINYDEEHIKSDIYNVLLRQMNYSDTIEDIKSIDIIKETYPEGLNKYNLFTKEVIYNLNICNN